MLNELEQRGVLIKLVQGDITRSQTEAIVNAANSSLLGGGGVDGAIHRAGGPAILEECKQIRAMQGGCPPGQAVITGGGKLKARYVIHTVGPIWRGGRNNEAGVLAEAYQNSLALACDNEIRSIAFPSISTGAYGYPLEEAAAVAIKTICDFLVKRSDCPLTEIHLVAFDPSTMAAYSESLSNCSPQKT